MKRVFFVALAVMAFVCGANAQTTKTGVLVIGNGNNAIGAGIQAAVSGVKTIILLPGPGFELSPVGKEQNSGIAAEFLKRLKADNFDNSTANAVLKTWMDSLKNLTVMRNASWLKFKRSGRGWVMELKDGKTIKAEILVNADKSGKAGETLQMVTAKTAALWQPFNYENKTCRTSIASGYFTNAGTANILSLYRFLNPLQENLVALDPAQESFAAGQAAGATAAYASFFKRKTSESNLKAIQGELINYKQSIVPFKDISPADSNWKAIQFIGVTGVLKADLSSDGAYFRPDQTVTSEEVKPVIKEYYYKAQIWFDDHKESQMTLASVLDLVCIVGNKSLKTTTEEVKKKWKTTYHFNSEFDPVRIVTRREFAVLVNEYLKPFDVNIDKTGRVLR
ncbi:MAG TPA: hypothetical protein VK541_20725 [Pedobacter sp.]|uniref:hypothetical protein n=1 Tax=Pedobacter sp. TaxID=1411316 RepID=UPI002B7D0E7C|nr:hypothetical protein [Pedobacter sp.]HMI04924.1 hypothetical protein [Pedobacter sp.]